MDRVFGLIAGALMMIAFATAMLVINPYNQIKRVEPEPGLFPYTIKEDHGRKIYVSLGCVYCHTQQPRDRNFGPDASRGWGRASTPGDYYYDYPHQLGTMRTGPDLLNIGARQPSVDWHLTHLFQPRAVVPGSIMPSYPFLFERKERAGEDDVVVALPPEWAGEGVVVATQDALDLVEYLRSLDRSYPSVYLPFARPKTKEGEGGK